MQFPFNSGEKKCMDIIRSHEPKRLRLLVANDDAFQLMIVVGALGLIDKIETIDQATNGQEAVELIKLKETDVQERYYDLIFLDLNMPILNGYESCEQIVKFYKEKHEEKIINNLNIFDNTNHNA